MERSQYISSLLFGVIQTMLVAQLVTKSGVSDSAVGMAPASFSIPVPAPASAPADRDAKR